MSPHLQCREKTGSQHPVPHSPHMFYSLSVPALCRLRASLRMPSKTPDKVPRYHLDLTSASCPHANCFCHNVSLQPSEHIGHVPNSLCASSHRHGTLRLPAPSDSLQDLLQGLPRIPTILEAALTSLLEWNQHYILPSLFPLWQSLPPDMRYNALTECSHVLCLPQGCQYAGGVPSLSQEHQVHK